MKKSLFLFSLLSAGVLLVGYAPAPRSYSDLATYKRVPSATRVDHLLKAGEDLFNRRRFEDAKSVFEMALGIDKKNLRAKFWVSKIKDVIEQEQNEQKKKVLYQKWGHLTPIDKIYENWHWGPEVGHFEIRYSEPKPYVPAVRKFRPKATDAEINDALKAYKNSKTADNAFELAMRYWSQRKKEEAIKYYFEAIDIDSTVLEKDDEYMLVMICEELEEKISTGKASSEDYYTFGRISLIQGSRQEGVNSIVKAIMQNKKLSNSGKQTLERYLAIASSDIMGLPAEVYSFRQAYVFDKEKDALYIRIILAPRDNNLLIPLDTTIPIGCLGDITIDSKDSIFVFGKPGIGDSTRLWFVLPEKEGDFPEYELKLIVNLKRDGDNPMGPGIDLSNYSLPSGLPDCWSFVISSEFNNTENTIPGNYEKTDKGVKISGYHLGSTDGKGPFVDFNNYNESLPDGVNIWKIIENREDEMSLF